jgi:hypothetical protein
MYDTGLVGGGFALIGSANRSYECVDYREDTPAAALTDVFKGNVSGSLREGLARYPTKISLSYLNANMNAVVAFRAPAEVSSTSIETMRPFHGSISLPHQSRLRRTVLTRMTTWSLCSTGLRIGRFSPKIRSGQSLSLQRHSPPQSCRVEKETACRLPEHACI